jgi:hypothetical protein
MNTIGHGRPRVEANEKLADFVMKHRRKQEQ